MYFSSVAALQIQPLPKVIRPLLPLFLAMIFSLLLVTFIPSLSLFLPRLFGF